METYMPPLGLGGKVDAVRAAGQGRAGGSRPSSRTNLTTARAAQPVQSSASRRGERGERRERLRFLSTQACSPASWTITGEETQGPKVASLEGRRRQSGQTKRKGVVARCEVAHAQGAS